MSNIEDMNAKAVKSYLGFEEGTYAARKGRLCFIKKIHFEMHPPSVTVQMMDTDTEVGTEFDRLQHLKSWFCDMCSAENEDVQAKKCFFCKMDRSYKEKITIKDTSNPSSNTNDKKAASPGSLQAVPEDEPVEEAPDISKAKEDETSDEVSEESKVTDDEYEELADPEPNASDHELSAEEEQQQEPVAFDPMYGKSKSPQQQQERYGYWPSSSSFQHGQPSRNRVHPQRGQHGHGAGTAEANINCDTHGHGQRTQNRKQQHSDFLPPPPVGQRRTAPNRRTRSQPRSFWMDDEDTMQFRRPLHSYWPRSWYDWDW